MIAKTVEAGIRLAELLAPEASAAAETAAGRLLRSALGSPVGAVGPSTAASEAGALGTIGVSVPGEGLTAVIWRGAPFSSIAESSPLARHEWLLSDLAHKQLVADRATLSAKISDTDIIAGFSEAKSMSPKGYKLLTESGASPLAPEVGWSLPRQLSDGTWRPGEWQVHRPTAAGYFGGMPQFKAHQSGLFIADNPMPWTWISEGRRLEAFEVQIGDLASARQWLLEPSGDFVAQRVRLLRHVPSEELQSLFGRSL